jgi:hypothetical protein
MALHRRARVGAPASVLVPARRRGLGAAIVVVAAIVLAALLVGTNIASYHLGKDCGAWEARERLKGGPRPTLCFTAP